MVPLKGPHGWLVVLWLLLLYMSSQPSFSEYIVPYLLFLAAVTCGGLRLFA
jgi:hypothetical protein